MIFNVDHIRTLASWAEDLRLTGQQEALYGLAHRIRYTSEVVTQEEVTSRAMSAIKVIRDTDPDQASFYRTMREWGVYE